MSFTGEIELFGFNYAPTNYAPCDGRVLPIAQYQQLFSLLGTNYGGNGTSTFGLPKMAAVTSSGPFYFICTSGTFPQRSAAGEHKDASATA